MEITKVKIKGSWVGIIGLPGILENLRNSMIMDEKGMKEYLLQEAKKQNYIEVFMEEEYKTALFSQYKRFSGKEVKEEENGLIIRIVGQGCMMCEKLEKDVMNVLAELNIKADIEHVTDVSEITMYKIATTPALLINDKIKYAGGIPGKNKLREWITEEAMKLNEKGNL